MRGRKQLFLTLFSFQRTIKKESPNEGTETRRSMHQVFSCFIHIKKESPNEGTETIIGNFINAYINFHKKRIPE